MEVVPSLVPCFDKGEPRQLVLTVIEAHDLNDSQVLARQDPFVRAQLIRTNAVAQTDYVWSGGVAPNWEASAKDGGNVLRLSWKTKMQRAHSFGFGSLERQNAESFPNALLLEVVNQNFFFDDKLAFCVVNFSEDHKFAWIEHPSNGLPSKKQPARIANGPITLSLARPVEVSVGEGTLSSRRQRGAGKLVVQVHFDFE
jgi:hypothetical protein